MSLEQLKTCKYISSVGMLLSLDDNEIITYHKEPNQIKHNFQKLMNGKDGDCIYIKFAFIRQFIYNVLPHINYRFILVTGDGDETMPDDIFDSNTFNSIINNDKIIHWYSVNCNESYHEKFSLIPIGVNYHSLSFGEFCGWHPTALSPLEQEKMIEDIKLKSPPLHERELKCYSNFHFVTYNEFGNPRQKAIDTIPKELVHYEEKFVPRSVTWENMGKHVFVLSPMGHGMDCHRTWEALILGCIVIVKKSQLDSLYNDLPVLIVNDWNEITEHLLAETLEKYKNTNFDYDKITLKYWVNKIKNTK
jgi:hypothetical protein